MEEPIREVFRNGRWYVSFRSPRLTGNHQMKRAYYVWTITHPDDPILKGECIHHKDEDKENDSPDNLEKMTCFEHKSLHSKTGVQALAKWRKENPEKAKRQSQENAHRLQDRLNSEPAFYKMVCDKRREGTYAKYQRR